MASSALELLTTESFEAAVSAGPVVVEFGASWCMPCRMLEPVLVQLSASFAGRVEVRTVDTDRETKLVEQFSVNTVPTVLVFKDGQIARRFVGLTSYERLAIAIEQIASPGTNATGTDS